MLSDPQIAQLLQAIPHLCNLLRAAGRLSIPKRALILTVLRENGTPLDVEGIYELARRREPDLNLATVYRTLAVLKEMGLVEQCYFARDSKRE